MTNDKNYYLLSSPDKVQLWSSKRLQFEVKEWQVEVRDNLKSALAKLNIVPNSILYARYTSADKGFCDTENVLFYNVGSGAFSKLCKEGIAFERAFEAPPPTNNGRVYKHYQCYTSARNHFKSTIWRQARILAKWKSIPLGQLNTGTKAHDIWYRVKKEWDAVKQEEAAAPGSNLGINLVLTVPPKTVSNPANVIKVLLDGIISSFQAHDGHEIDEISQRVAHQLGKNSAKVQQQLMARTGAVLGVNRLVKKFRNGVQWNPVDDRLVWSRLLVVRHKTATEVICTGELFEVTDDKWADIQMTKDR